MQTAAVLLAAGTGRRFGGKRPKQFELLQRQPLFLKSFRVFAAHPSVREIVVVTLRERLPQVEKILRSISKKKMVHVVEGGTFRGASVRNGVRALRKKSQVVLIHDTARPLVTGDIIRRVETASLKSGAALAAWPLPDTLKATTIDGRVRKTIPRKNLWLAQTPQGFRWDVAIKCLLKPNPAATDDVQLAERKGYRVRVVEGSASNFKITTAEDLKRCQKLLH